MPYYRVYTVLSSIFRVSASSSAIISNRLFSENNFRGPGQILQPKFALLVNFQWKGLIKSYFEYLCAKFRRAIARFNGFNLINLSSTNLQQEPPPQVLHKRSNSMFLSIKCLPPSRLHLILSPQNQMKKKKNFRKEIFKIANDLSRLNNFEIHKFTDRIKK